MKLDEIQTMWSADCKINNLDLRDAAVGVPQLHAKYLNLLTNVKLKIRKANSDLIRLRKNKSRYFKGELSLEELTELGWTQYLYAKPLKGDLETMIEAEDDVLKQVEKLEYLLTIHYQLESILKSLNSRTWDIKNAITWAQFTNGGF